MRRISIRLLYIAILLLLSGIVLRWITRYLLTDYSHFTVGKIITIRASEYWIFDLIELLIIVWILIKYRSWRERLVLITGSLVFYAIILKAVL